MRSVQTSMSLGIGVVLPKAGRSAEIRWSFGFNLRPATTDSRSCRPSYGGTRVVPEQLDNYQRC